MSQSTIRRWGPWLGLVVLFAIATSLLSWWQFDRRNDRVERINQVIANYDQQPIDYVDLNWTANPDGTSDLEWRPVRVSGRYLPEQALLVRNRPLNGQPGFLQLVPLELADGRILIVERGWLQASSELITPVANPLPADSFHDLVLRLRVGEPSLGRAPAETLASIDLNEISDRIQSDGSVITEHYGRVVTESPNYSQAPLPMPKPSLNEGNHLSYAIQWIIFGLMAFFAFFWAYRNDRRLALEAAGLKPKRIRKKTRADLDAEFEDATQ